MAITKISAATIFRIATGPALVLSPTSVLVLRLVTYFRRIRTTWYGVACIRVFVEVLRLRRGPLAR